MWRVWVRRGGVRVLVGKPEGKRSLGRPRRRWVDIRLDVQEVGCKHSLVLLRMGKIITRNMLS